MSNNNKTKSLSICESVCVQTHASMGSPTDTKFGMEIPQVWSKNTPKIFFQNRSGFLKNHILRNFVLDFFDSNLLNGVHHFF